MTVIEVPGLSPVHAQLVLAMLAQMAIAIVLLFVLPFLRVSSMRAKQATLDELGRYAFPKLPTQVSDCFNNQFQIPVLFYALCLLILVLRFESDSLVWLAWAFVGFRVLHALVFVTVNFVPLRSLFFILSSISFLAMFIQVALQLLGV